MAKKKIILVTVLVSSLASTAYILFPGMFGGDEKPKPAASLSPVAKSTKTPEAPKTVSETNTLVAKTEGKGVELRASGTLVQLPNGDQEGDRGLVQSLRERQIAFVNHEIMKTKRSIEREEIEADTALEKAKHEKDKILAERKAFSANPSAYVSKSSVVTGAPPVFPMTATPGNTGPIAMTTVEQPTLKMISTVGNERSAYIEYRGGVYKVKQGEKISHWTVKTVTDDAVQLVAGKEAQTLGFALPAGGATPVGASAPAGALPPPPGVATGRI